MIFGFTLPNTAVTMSIIKDGGSYGRTGVKGKLIGRVTCRTCYNSADKDYRLGHIGKAN